MSKTNILQTMLTLCVVGAFGIFGASCGSSEDNCSSDQAFYQGQCVDTCDSVEDCQEGQSCVGSPEINGKVCVGGGTDPDGGMDGGVDDGGNDDDGGNGDDGGNDGGEDVDPQACETANTCIQNACSEFLSSEGVEEPYEFAICVEDSCQQEVNNCPDFTGRSCSDLASCIGNCTSGESGQACRNECFDQSGIVGGQKYNGLVSCIQANNCESTTCYFENCADRYYACFPDQSPGQRNCAETFRCNFNLQSNEVCQENPTNQARIDYGTMIDCAESNGCTETDMEGNTSLNVACMVAKCQPEVGTCGLQDTGNLSCSEGSACTRANSGSDQIQCLLDFSSAEEAGKYTAYQDCVDQSCQNAADVTLCADANCGSERDACGLAGSQSNCAQSWDCLQGNIEECETADNPLEVLFNNYVYEGTAQAQSDFYALFNCTQDSNCTDLACLETECGSEADACGVTFGN